MIPFLELFSSRFASKRCGARAGHPRPAGGCRPRLESLEPRTLRAVLSVGPGRDYPTPDAVPWASLPPGTDVDIYWKATPYHSKIDIVTSDVRVIGIPGPLGQLPVLDGANARENADASYFINEIGSEGLITVAPADWRYQVDSVLIQGLEIEGANLNNHFTDANGDTQWFQDASAGVALYSATNVTIAGCTIHGNGSGIFGKSFADGYIAGDGNLVNIQVLGNHIYGNGVVGSDHEHDTYIEGFYTLYEFNTYGPLVDGAAGVALKDRSDQPTIAYNFITGGTHQLDLVEAEDGAPDMTADPGYGQEWVYGNVLVNDGSAGSMVHFGFDDTRENSQKVLYFFDNTVVSWNSVTGGGRYYTGVFKAGGGSEVYVFDNVFHQQSYDGSWSGQFYLSWADYGDATVYVGVNLGDAGMLRDDGINTTIGWANMLLVDNPGFVNVLLGDFRLGPLSPARGAARGIYGADGFVDEVGIPPVVYQYTFLDGGWTVRPDSANLGAWESDSLSEA